MLLWLFQIVLLDDFYRLQKTDMLKSSSQSIVQNINNENLDALVDRIAEENNVAFSSPPIPWWRWHRRIFPPAASYTI